MVFIPSCIEASFILKSLSDVGKLIKMLVWSMVFIPMQYNAGAIMSELLAKFDTR